MGTEKPDAKTIFQYTGYDRGPKPVANAEIEVYKDNEKDQKIRLQPVPENIGKDGLLFSIR